MVSSPTRTPTRVFTLAPEYCTSAGIFERSTWRFSIMSRQGRFWLVGAYADRLLTAVKSPATWLSQVAPSPLTSCGSPVLEKLPPWMGSVRSEVLIGSAEDAVAESPA